MKEAETLSLNDGIAPVGRTDFPIKTFQMALNSLTRDAKLIGYLLITKSLLKQKQYLIFAVGQSFPPVPCFLHGRMQSLNAEFIEFVFGGQAC